MKIEKKKKIDVEVTFVKLLYSLVVVYVKREDKKAEPPQFKDGLQPLLQQLAREISEVCLVGDKRYIKKEEFLDKIQQYVKKVIDRRERVFNTLQTSGNDENEGNNTKKKRN